MKQEIKSVNVSGMEIKNVISMEQRTKEHHEANQKEILASLKGTKEFLQQNKEEGKNMKKAEKAAAFLSEHMGMNLLHLSPESLRNLTLVCELMMEEQGIEKASLLDLML